MVPHEAPAPATAGEWKLTGQEGGTIPTVCASGKKDRHHLCKSWFWAMTLKDEPFQQGQETINAHEPG